ncbi:Kynureninase [Flavobacteriaceae bacterium MAR_2010_188]|nr:Kynureninase [Flavobacteriaceae bacterium MAR_2010_188]
MIKTVIFVYTSTTFTLQTFQNGIEYAKSLDENDDLAMYRERFHIPKDKEGNDLIYLCGNSLGLQPKSTSEYVNQELSDWAKYGVNGHFEAKNPWLNYHELLTENMAKIVGAKPIEVVVMNTLTTNLHLMMVSFYKPTKSRYKILIEADAFPSDKYAVESQLQHHGFNVDGIVLWKARKGESEARYEDLEEIMKNQGHEIALVMIGAVNYYTGQFFNLKKITELGHSYGCKVGFDCAHGAGNVDLDLHLSGADFAVWCSYKYLNSGPGSLAGCFVHERYAYGKTLNRFTGWWAHNKETRFKMRDDFDMLPGAEGWQLSNPPILSMAAIKASLDLIAKAGFERLLEKSKKLTAYYEFLLLELKNSSINIITPSDTNRRGCQISIQVKNADKSLFDKISRRGVVCDWREPDVIRCAPVPLYNSFLDVYKMVQILKDEL